KNYDEGEIVFQAKTRISKDDTAESLAEKIHKLEYQYYPEVIAQCIDKL
ncbi:MAG TPA: phosphoribosylglycinamide formyltransferase, partial [Bacteroidetes bacterium]|nr:phosphoribosylglycinamide formyltransferase [Bacteroidota bacterium]